MASATRTLKLANSVDAGTQVTVGNYAYDTTLSVDASGSDFIDVPGYTSHRLDPLSSQTFVSNGSDRWRTLAGDIKSLLDIYEFGVATELTGAPFTIDWTRSALNPYQSSPHFSLSAGVLTATRPVVLRAGLQVYWEGTATGNNQDFGIIVDSVTTGTSLGAAIARSIFSARSGAFFQQETTSQLFSLAEGETLRFDASELTGQSGTSDLEAALLVFTVE